VSRDVGEDGVPGDGLHGVGVRLHAGARRDAEVAGLGVDRPQAAVVADAHPGDVVAHGPDLPPAEALGRDHHGEVGLAALAGEGGGDVGGLALGALEAEDEHVLGEPALLVAEVAADAQRQALLAEQDVAAVAEPIDQMVLSCGKWQMKRRSGLQSRVECRPRLKSFESPSMSSAPWPMRVMIRMLRAT
jgi:hypothetical protein